MSLYVNKHMDKYPTGWKIWKPIQYSVYISIITFHSVQGLSDNDCTNFMKNDFV